MIKAQETVTDTATGETKVRTSSRPTHPHRKRIPISAAQRIAEEYGYDQVLTYAGKVDQPSRPGGEHMTTYGVTRIHCDVAAEIGSVLKRIMSWDPEVTVAAVPVVEEVD